jgi:hypothetical protein
VLILTGIRDGKTILEAQVVNTFSKRYSVVKLYTYELIAVVKYMYKLYFYNRSAINHSLYFLFRSH